LRGELPYGVTINKVSDLPQGAVFAVDPAGKRVAVATPGLGIIDLPTAVVTTVNFDPTEALAWSLDGERLAAAFCGVSDCRVRIYDPQGVLKGETPLPGKVGALVWRSATELLISVAELKLYTFGVDYAQKLYRWDGVTAPVGELLHNTTIYGAAGRKRAPFAYRLFTLTLSPYGDSILYPLLYEPPEFPPYLRVTERNLASGVDRVIAKAGIDAPVAVYAASADTVWSGDGTARLTRYDIWSERELDSLSTPGRLLAASPGGRNLLADGTLYRDAKPLLSFLPDVAGAFAADGARLFIRSGDRMFLVEGLPVDRLPVMTEGDRDHLLQLRKWRSEGLISTDEFTSSLERMKTP
jgi:hypothetical protein